MVCQDTRRPVSTNYNVLNSDRLVMFAFGRRLLPEEAVGAVRKFLSAHRAGHAVPGRNRILELYADFTGELPVLLEAVNQDRQSMTFAEFRGYVEDYVVPQRGPL